MLHYDSKTPITDIEKEEFEEILLSLCIDKRKQNKISETEWFTINDIDAIPIDCGNINILMPAQYLYFNADTKENDICLTASGINYSSLRNTLKETATILMAFPYEKNETIMVYRERANNQDNFTIDNYSEIILSLTSMKMLYEKTYGLKVYDSGIFISEGNEEDSISKVLNKLYWVKMRYNDSAYNSDKLVYVTILDKYKYTIVFEKKNIDSFDEQKYDNIISQIEKSKYTNRK